MLQNFIHNYSENSTYSKKEVINFFGLPVAGC
jgi:hypothetical protein